MSAILFVCFPRLIASHSRCRRALPAVDFALASLPPLDVASARHDHAQATSPAYLSGAKVPSRMFNGWSVSAVSAKLATARAGSTEFGLCMRLLHTRSCSLCDLSVLACSALHGDRRPCSTLHTVTAPVQYQDCRALMPAGHRRIHLPDTFLSRQTDVTASPAARPGWAWVVGAQKRSDTVWSATWGMNAVIATATRD